VRKDAHTASETRQSLQKSLEEIKSETGTLKDKREVAGCVAAACVWPCLPVWGLPAGVRPQRSRQASWHGSTPAPCRA